FAFEMRDKPWMGAKDSVLEWLSDQTGFPVYVPGPKPTGTFTFISPRSNGVPKLYSLAEVIEILNNELHKQDLALVRGRNIFVVQEAEEKKPDKQASSGTPKEKAYTFEFVNKPWTSVFEWLAEQTGLPVTVHSIPSGTLTLISPEPDGRPKQHTLSEVIDLLNRQLAKQNLVLIRTTRAWVLIPLDRVLPVQQISP